MFRLSLYRENENLVIRLLLSKYYPYLLEHFEINTRRNVALPKLLHKIVTSKAKPSSHFSFVKIYWNSNI